jgi:hypothetical protein
VELGVDQVLEDAADLRPLGGGCGAGPLEGAAAGPLKGERARSQAVALLHLGHCSLSI